MRGWVGRSSQWKWLRPGMGVKRWLVLLIAGLVLLALAVATLPRMGRVWTLIQRWRVIELNPLVEFALFGAAGLALVVVAIFALNRSLVSAFRRDSSTDVVDVVYRHRQRQRGPKVVALGGGHGLNTLLRGLKQHTDNITAIVTVADDGGSSGRLRRELGMLPPGDLCSTPSLRSAGRTLRLGQPFRQGHRLLGRIAGEGARVFHHVWRTCKIVQRLIVELLAENSPDLSDLMRVARRYDQSKHAARRYQWCDR